MNLNVISIRIIVESYIEISVGISQYMMSWFTPWEMKRKPVYDVLLHSVGDEAENENEFDI